MGIEACEGTQSDPTLITPVETEIRRIDTLPYIEATTIQQIISELESFRTGIPEVATLTDERKKQVNTFLRGIMEMSLQRINIPVVTESGTTWPVYDMFDAFNAKYFRGRSDCGGCYNGALAGAGFVYEAVGRQAGPDFQERFQTLARTHPDVLETAIDQSLTVNGREYSYNDRSTWFSRMNPYLQLPDYQTNLKTGVEYIQTRLPGIQDPIEDGAISAYRTLEVLSPYLTPPQA